jgi:RimJ/RimL family protein N-acetyltransferase
VTTPIEYMAMEREAANCLPGVRRALYFHLRDLKQLFAIKIVRFKYRIAGGGLTLRMYRFRDLPVLHSLFHIPSFLHTSGVEPKTVRSLPLFWRWIRNSFHVFYIIEVAEDSGRRIIGFAGLYHIEIRKSLWLSLALFDAKDRGQGYGRRAVELLLKFFQKGDVVRTVYAEVMKNNLLSLCFCKRLGFELFGERRESFLLKSQIAQHDLIRVSMS